MPIVMWMSLLCNLASCSTLDKLALRPGAEHDLVRTPSDLSLWPQTATHVYHEMKPTIRDTKACT